MELQEFIIERSIEWHKQQNEDGEPDVLLFINVLDFEEFHKLIKAYRPDGGIPIRLFDSYFVVWIRDICIYFGIDIDDLFVE